jgi:hypothetical protein
LLFGYHPVLPIEVDIPTWRIINWDSVTSTEDLLEARIRMLERREEDIKKAARAVIQFRRKIAASVDQAKRFKMRKEPLAVGDLVLVYDMTRAIDKSRWRKLTYRWRGPFRIHGIDKEKHYYQLMTLDGVQIPGTMPPHRVKKFEKDETGWWTCNDDETLLKGTGQDGLDTQDWPEDSDQAEPTGQDSPKTPEDSSETSLDWEFDTGDRPIGQRIEVVLPTTTSRLPASH